MHGVRSAFPQYDPLQQGVLASQAPPTPMQSQAHPAVPPHRVLVPVELVAMQARPLQQVALVEQAKLSEPQVVGGVQTPPVQVSPALQQGTVEEQLCPS